MPFIHSFIVIVSHSPKAEGQKRLHDVAFSSDADAGSDESARSNSLDATTLIMGSEIDVNLAAVAGEPECDFMPTLMPEHCIRKYLDLAELSDEEWRALGTRKSFGWKGMHV